MKPLKFLILSAIVCGVSASQAQTKETTEVVETTVTTTTTKTLEKPKPELKKVAIFVRNDSGKAVLDDKAKFLESSIGARLNNMGFGVVNHDLVVRNLNAYLGDPNAKYRSIGEKVKKLTEGESVDAKLFENASGLRLAEMIGADYIMSVSYSSLGTEKKSFSGYGIQTVNLQYNLRGNYSLYEGGGGTGTAGGVVKASKSVRQTENLVTVSDDILNGLVDDIADQMASLLNKQRQAGQIIAKEDSAGEIEIYCEIEAMSFPEIIEKDGKYSVGTGVLPATIPYVMADIDGVAQTIGGKIQLSKGLHIFKINQKDIVPIEKNIFVTGRPGQVISFSLSLSDEARQRWKDDMRFIETMKDRARESDNRRILTEAEAARVKGIAEMYQNSGFKIGVKVDAKNLPDVKQSQSIFGQ